MGFIRAVAFGFFIRTATAGNNAGSTVDLSACSTRVGSNIDLRVSAEVDISNDGNRIIIGEDYDNRARVFFYFEKQWVQLGDDIHGGTESLRFGRAVAMSYDGNRIAVGGRYASSDADYVRAFEYQDDSTVQPVQLGDDILGHSFSISNDGSRMVIGASETVGDGESRGYVQVYGYQGDDWIQLGSDIVGESDRFGEYVAVSGDGARIVFMAGIGNARVYGYLDNGWVQIGNDIIEDTRSSMRVGISGNGNRIVVGMPWEAEEARVYQYEADGYAQIGNVIEGSRLYSDSFGASVDISQDGDTVVVSDPHQVVWECEVLCWDMEDAGSVRVFKYKNGDWQQVLNVEGTEDYSYLGNSVAVSGDSKRIALDAGGIQVQDSWERRVKVLKINEC